MADDLWGDMDELGDSMLPDVEDVEIGFEDDGHPGEGDPVDEDAGLDEETYGDL